MNSFPAKLLLFGEYSILLGSPALSIPFDLFTAALKISGTPDFHPSAENKASNLQISRVYNAFTEVDAGMKDLLDMERLQNDLSNGLYLESDIPQQYGMGSSGALCAALYHRYGVFADGSGAENRFGDLTLLRNVFIRLESFFHGKSSGFDPLVSYLNAPLFLTPDNEITLLDRDLLRNACQPFAFFLIDTGRPSGTRGNVTKFLNNFAPGGIITAAGKTMIRMVSASLEKLLGHEPQAFWEEVLQLSEFQLKHLKNLVPDDFIPLWKYGLKEGSFALKICGSGGGGFLLCISRSKESTAHHFNQNVKDQYSLLTIEL